MNDATKHSERRVTTNLALLNSFFDFVDLILTEPLNFLEVALGSIVHRLRSEAWSENHAAFSNWALTATV